MSQPIEPYSVCGRLVRLFERETILFETQFSMTKLKLNRNDKFLGFLVVRY